MTRPLCISIKGTHFLRRNPKGTHTELKGNPVTRIKMLNIYYSCLLMLWFTRWAIQLFNHLLGLPNRASLRYLRYKHSDIHVKVLSLQNRKSFEYFFCFHRTLGISPKDLEGFKDDIAFIYTALACSLATNLNVDLFFLARNFICSCVIRCEFWLVSRKDDCLECILRKLFWIKKLINKIFLHLSN